MAWASFIADTTGIETYDPGEHSSFFVAIWSFSEISLDLEFEDLLNALTVSEQALPKAKCGEVVIVDDDCDHELRVVEIARAGHAPSEA